MIKVIKNAKILTMENEKIITGDIVIENNYIKEIVNNYTGDFDIIIDAENNLVMPGLINSHTHLGMSIFKNTNDTYKLMDWLKNIAWKIEDKLTEEDIYYTNLLSCIEMIKSGTTTCADHYFGVFEGIKAIKKSKIRCLYTRCLMDSDNNGQKRIDDFEKLYDLYKDTSSLITFSVAPHSLYTCSESYLKLCHELAIKHKLIIHTHYNESEEELKSILKKHNKSSLDILNDTNLINDKLLLAHGTYLNKEELNIFKNKDISIVHNPISNLSLGCGIADIVKYKSNNTNICLGTDGVGSGYNLDMFKHMNIAYLLQKGIHKDPTVISAFDVLKMATINGSKALGIDNIGCIKKGNLADLIIIDIKRLEKNPTNNLLVHLVSNVDSSDILTTIVNGEILMLNKQLVLDIDLEKLENKIVEITKKVGLNE